MGFVLGMLAPLLGFAAYGGIYVTAIRPHFDFPWFVNDLFLGTAEFRPRVASLSLIADAVLFFLFDRKDMHKAMQGIIMAMLAYGVYIVGALIALEMV
jgi:amino acid permease